MSGHEIGQIEIIQPGFFYRISCSCGCEAHIDLQCDPSLPPWASLEIFADIAASDWLIDTRLCRAWWRIKKALRILVTGRIEGEFGMVIENPEKMTALAKLISKFAEDIAAKQKGDKA